MEQQLVDMNDCENEVKNKSLVYFKGETGSREGSREYTPMWTLYHSIRPWNLGRQVKVCESDWNRQKQSLPIHECGFDLLCTIMATQTVRLYRAQNLQHGNGTVVGRRTLEMAQHWANGTYQRHPFLPFFLKVNTFRMYPVASQPMCACVCESCAAEPRRMCGRYILAFYVNGCDPSPTAT